MSALTAAPQQISLRGGECGSVVWTLAEPIIAPSGQDPYVNLTFVADDLAFDPSSLV
tara:strand:- start:345 stop:515 length:171 start_codon:yes stop_codon:yes gene_type:complete